MPAVTGPNRIRRRAWPEGSVAGFGCGGESRPAHHRTLTVQPSTPCLPCSTAAHGASDCQSNAPRVAHGGEDTGRWPRCVPRRSDRFAFEATPSYRVRPKDLMVVAAGSGEHWRRSGCEAGWLLLQSDRNKSPLTFRCKQKVPAGGMHRLGCTPSRRANRPVTMSR